MVAPAILALMQHQRLTIAFFGVAAISAAMSVVLATGPSLAPPSRPARVLAGIVALLALGELLTVLAVRTPNGLPVGLVAANAALVYFTAPAVRNRPLAAAVAAAAAAAIAVFVLSTSWHRGFDANYEAVIGEGVLRALARTGDRPQKLCVLWPKCYPYYGSDRRRTVVRPIWIPDYERFVGLLRREGVEIVVTSTDGGTDGRYAAVNRMIDGDGRFENIYDYRNIILYHFKR